MWKTGRRCGGAASEDACRAVRLRWAAALVVAEAGGRAAVI